MTRTFRAVGMFSCLLPALGAGCGGLVTRSGSWAVGDQATVGQVIDLVNRNATAVQRLQADEVAITLRAGDRPVQRLATAAVTHLALRGRMALEQPRRFRMTAGVGFTQEVDLGSNENEFWFYLRQATEPSLGPKPQPILYHCSYDVYATVPDRLPIQPEWLIESLGLTPLDPSQPHSLRPGSSASTVEVVTPRRLPDGRAGSKVTVVDRRRGWVTGVHLETGGRRIASAALSDHSVDAAFGAAVPRTITLNWPEADLQLTVRLDDPRINPEFTATQAVALWTMPYDQLVGRGAAREVNLADLIRPAPPRGFPSTPPARLGPSLENRVEGD